MSAIYYAVNDDKKQAIVIGHTSWFNGVEDLKTEQGILGLIKRETDKPYYKYAESEFSPLAHALVKMGVTRVVLEDYDPCYFEVLKYEIIATIYTDKWRVGMLVGRHI